MSWLDAAWALTVAAVYGWIIWFIMKHGGGDDDGFPGS